MISHAANQAPAPLFEPFRGHSSVRAATVQTVGPPPFKLFVFKQLKPVLGIPYGRERLRRMILEDLFPAPIKLSSKLNAWDERDLVAWLQSRKAASQEMGCGRG